MKLKSKIKTLRYKNLFKQMVNWPSYLVYKVMGGASFTFKFRTGQELEIPKEMMGAFRECFFDQIYYRNFPSNQVKDLKTVIDVGANAGYFSIYTLFNFPNAKLHAVEPMPICIKTIQNYANIFDQYTLNVHPIALSGSNGKIDLFVDDEAAYSTTSSLTARGNQKAISVETKSLKQFLSDEHINKVDLLKMDCEGAEYETLYACTESVFNAISRLSIETHLGKGEKENTNSLAVFLETLGYTCSHFDEGNTGYIWAWKK